MRVTTQTEYAVRALINLVGAENPVSVTSMAKREGLSRDYVEQLLIKLRRAKIVKSYRGVQGGYMLCRKPGRITFADIHQAVEGDVFRAPCDQFLGSCKGQKKCRLTNVWGKIGTKVHKAFRSVTLLDAWEEEVLSRMTPKKRLAALRSVR